MLLPEMGLDLLLSLMLEITSYNFTTVNRFVVLVKFMFQHISFFCCLEITRITFQRRNCLHLLSWRNMFLNINCWDYFWFLAAMF